MPLAKKKRSKIKKLCVSYKLSQQISLLTWKKIPAHDEYIQHERYRTPYKNSFGSLLHRSILHGTSRIGWLKSSKRASGCPVGEYITELKLGLLLRLKNFVKMVVGVQWLV